MRDDNNNNKVINSSARWQVPGDVPRSRPLQQTKPVQSVARQSVEPVASFSSESPISRLSNKRLSKDVHIDNIITEQATSVKVSNKTNYFSAMVVVLLMLGLVLLQSSTGLFDKTISHAIANTNTAEIKTPLKTDVEPLTHIKEEQSEVTTNIPVATDKQITINLTQAPNTTSRIIIHTVVKGDTLWHIAGRYVNDPFRYPELTKLSKISNPDLIYPGNKVYIQI